MKPTINTKDILVRVNSEETKLGDLKKLAKELGTDQQLAMELWSEGGYYPRQLAILIMDKKQLTQELIDDLDRDMNTHPSLERNHLMEWLMANQLMKNKATIALIQSWRNSSSTLQRRTFWYYQARKRWTGQEPPENTPELLERIEKDLQTEDSDVQWAMNFTAGWIGVFDPKYRDRCIAIGKKSGLYKDEVVARGCTPNYLPLFIETEVKKRNK